MQRTSWMIFGLILTMVLGMQVVNISRWLQANERLGAVGTASSSNYTLDGTLEPDEIPGWANSADLFGTSFDGDSVLVLTDSFGQDEDNKPLTVGGPARIPKQILTGSSLSSDESFETADIVVYERKIEPPQRLYAKPSYFEPDGKYALVQYKSTPQQQRSRVQSAPATTPNASNNVAVEQESGPKREPEHPESLKRAIRSALVTNSKRAITTQHNSPGDVLLMALPYGADAKVWQPNQKKNPKDRTEPGGSYIYSIGSLCWNFNCAGKALLRSDGKRVYARVGAGYQKRPASFLALLAMSNIMPNYELKVDGGTYTIEHLIASEKAAVSKGMNLSMILVGLSFYGKSEESWKNEMGEAWSIEKMLVEELNRSIDQGTSDVTDWLLGLTAAVNLYEEEGRTLRGPSALAKKQLGVYHDFVLSVQNENHLWHPKFFLFKGVSPDVYETLYSGGHILRWLSLSLDDDQLDDVRVRKAVANLAATINRVPSNVPAGTLTDRQLESLAVSLQALAVYYQRTQGSSPLEEAVPAKEGQVAVR